jgi:hypothetical protein
METYQVGLLSLAFFGLWGVYAYYGWRRKISKQEESLLSPAIIDFNDSGLKTSYVATTFSGRPLDRVAAYGLAHRGNAWLNISFEGLQVNRSGERSFLIPRESLIELSERSAVIDRAVEKNGLTTISWLLGNQMLDSHFRFVSSKTRAEFVAELKEFIGQNK